MGTAEFEALYKQTFAQVRCPARVALPAAQPAAGSAPQEVQENSLYFKSSVGRTWESEAYALPFGTTAQIVRCTSNKTDWRDCSAYFVHNGLQYTVYCSGTDKASSIDADAVIKAVLDSFSE